MNKNKRSVQLIFLSYFGAIIISALILMLPIANKVDLGFVDAVFTTSSAISCTGLIVKSTGNDFTLFGQIVIISIIQLGGFGYMSLAILLSIALGKKLSFSERMILKESYEHPTMSGVIRFLKRVFLFIVIIEIIGAFFLAARFANDFPLIDAIWYGTFHSISAFNNAGFSLFDTSMINYKGDLAINFLICSLIIIGGLGYMVIFELYYFRGKLIPKLSSHAKIILITTAILILLGTLLFFSLEYANPKTIGNLSFVDKIITSIFASVNFRTSGFNSVDVSGLTDSLMFFSTALMLIGTAPGSTGGGIKITTFVVLVTTAWYFLRGDMQPRFYKRAIPVETIYKSLSIAMVAVIYVCISTVVIVELEHKDFVKTFFEIISAFATVGISVGDGNVASYSNLFSDTSKLLIALLMFMGKIGVLSFSTVLLGQSEPSNIKYPEGNVIL